MSHRTMISLDVKLHALLKQEAIDNYRSLSSQIEMNLVEHRILKRRLQNAKNYDGVRATQEQLELGD